MMKMCVACGKEQKLEDFHRHRGRKDGLNSVCKKCHTKRVSIYARTPGGRAARAVFWADYKERKREHLQDYFRDYFNDLSSEQKEKYTETRKRRKARSPRHALYGALYAAGKRWPSDDIVTIDELMEMWDRQGGLCAVSGLPMTWGKETGRRRSADRTSVSIDRIDGNKGYALSNIRLVCWQVNLFRNRWSDDEMYQMARSIVRFSAGEAAIAGCLSFGC